MFTTENNEPDSLKEIHPNELRYSVIIDCGSSGSRAHIFKWKKKRKSSHIELVKDDTKSRHITPGLSTFKDDPDKASDYMEPIMDYISELIPTEKHYDTSIHFMATAGLRLLDESTQKAILSDIDKDLKGKYSFPKIKSQVITGEQEGIYSWISLNMNKNLRNSQYSQTYGMIEMGGASTQVAFELNDELEEAILNDLKNYSGSGSGQAVAAFKNEQLRLDVSPEHSVRLITVTFLGLGVNSAREAAIDLYIKDYVKNSSNQLSQQSDFSQFEMVLKDSCLPAGSSEVVIRPTALLTNNDTSIGLVIKQSEQTFRIRLEGTGDFFSCMSHLERVIQFARRERLNCQSKSQPCAMDLLGTNFIPYHKYPFIGLSEMFFTTNEMIDSAGQFNRSKVLHETKRICETKYNDLLSRYVQNGSSADSDRVLYECFKASWLLTILHTSGLNMPTNYENFRTLDELDGEQIDWTTGAMLMEVALKA